MSSNISEMIKIEDGLKYGFKFLIKISSGNITINTLDKYYTQIVSQIGITNAKQTIFIVWIPQVFFGEYISFKTKNKLGCFL